jgi:hypothetical protein
MQMHRRSLLVAAVLLFSTPLLRAQHAADPSGHWEGAIHVPNMDVNIQIDLARQANGTAVATFTGVNIAGFPLSEVVIEGAALRFQLKVDGGGAFSAKLSDDGKTMTGDFTASNGGYTVPFSLTRNGDARFAAPARNPAVGKELEGHWAGTLDVNGVSMHVTLTLTNRPDGTAIGSVANLDEGGVEIPIATISQQASNVTFNVAVVNGSYTGTLNAAGTELAGTWTQRTLTAPLVFRRADR